MPWLLVLGALVTLLAGCAGPMPSDRDAVAVTAVNYTGRELNAVLFIDPQSTRVAGGTGADPYGASGAMCCYALPRRWQPGIKVKVRYDWWTGSSADRRYETVEQELPPYPTDEPGVLWALFYEDGSVEVLASAVDPGHPKWPGKLKHWPVPSREYKLKLWQRQYEDALAGIKTFERQPQRTQEDLEKEWSFYRGFSQEMRDRLAAFSGPLDPAFSNFLEQQRQIALETYRRLADQLLRVKP
ncbi:DUF3304 domain-containing protein [Caldimonas aquatica]|uniref:DUF3304 domain-containing protein n=1 Tax=Caldimonas aquatica TaxID=376175 RepID=A0ABY6MSU2_9BURK|nr:DUF3304 domain-containing protein [Schlegelella aquatica]UZD55072.1 DUF3304 domain-containing protein [Schlegelella aquatica]